MKWSTWSPLSLMGPQLKPSTTLWTSRYRPAGTVLSDVCFTHPHSKKSVILFLFWLKYAQWCLIIELFLYFSALSEVPWGFQGQLSVCGSCAEFAVYGTGTAWLRGPALSPFLLQRRLERPQTRWGFKSCFRKINLTAKGGPEVAYYLRLVVLRLISMLVWWSSGLP